MELSRQAYISLNGKNLIAIEKFMKDEPQSF